MKHSAIQTSHSKGEYNFFQYIQIFLQRGAYFIKLQYT